jgi:hypothetical protein
MLAAGIQEKRGVEHEKKYCANTYPLYFLGSTEDV